MVGGIYLKNSAVGMGVGNISEPMVSKGAEEEEGRGKGKPNLKNDRVKNPFNFPYFYENKRSSRLF